MTDPRNNRPFIVRAFLLDDLSSDYDERRRQLITRFAWLLVPILILEGGWSVWRATLPRGDLAGNGRRPGS